jgi:hypothetical protein
MRDIRNKLLKAWYEMLSGHISVNVYRVGVPETEDGNYVVLRVESETERRNSATFVTNPVVICEIVTRHSTIIDDGVANSINDEILQLLKPGQGTNGLPVQSGIQVVDVSVQSTDITEDDGVTKYHRLINRNLHRVVQT